MRHGSAVVRRGAFDNRWRNGQIFHIGFQPGTVLDCGGTFGLFLSVAKSGFGGALASMSVPVMLFVLSPKEALAVLLPVFLITSIGVFFIWYKYCHWRLFGFMCLFALVSQFVGWWFNRQINDWIFYHASYSFLLGLGIKMLFDALAT